MKEFFKNRKRKDQFIPGRIKFYSWFDREHTIMSISLNDDWNTIEQADARTAYFCDRFPAPKLFSRISGARPSNINRTLGQHDGNTYASAQPFLYTRNVRVSWNRPWSPVERNPFLEFSKISNSCLDGGKWDTDLNSASH